MLIFWFVRSQKSECDLILSANWTQMIEEKWRGVEGKQQQSPPQSRRGRHVWEDGEIRDCNITADQTLGHTCQTQTSLKAGRGNS